MRHDGARAGRRGWGVCVLAGLVLAAATALAAEAPADAAAAGAAGAGRRPLQALLAYERGEERVRDTLLALAASDAPFADKVRTYRAALWAAHGERAFGPRAPHLTRHLVRFLELPSVQRELRAMAPAARRARLRELRAALGLDAAALARWEALDAARDAARATGARYLAERARLDALPPGPGREAQLRALQDQLFGPAEAVFLRSEEAAGVYRFRTPQTLGVN